MNKLSSMIIFCLCALFSLTACAGRGGVTAEVNVEATVQAAVAATDTAQQQLQATIDAAVQATTVVQGAAVSATPVPAATALAAPTPVVITQVVTEAVYITEDVYMTMTEEELAALIDDAVQQATAATAAYSTAAMTATADGTVTTADVESIDVYVQLADETVAYAEELLATYADLYGENTDAIVQGMAELETELSTIAESTTSMASSLDEIEETLNAGLELADETIAQVEATAATATAAVQAAQAQTAAMVSNVQASAAGYSANLESTRAEFATIVQNVQPQAIAANQAEALSSVFTYADTVRTALGDNALDLTEMQDIAQRGANAVAGLNSQGGPLSVLSSALTDVTNALARGELDRARQGLSDVEARMPARDSIGNLAGNAAGDRPAIGSNRPSRRP